jgi:hypothetical protein
MKQRLVVLAVVAALPACIDDPEYVELAEEEQEVLVPCLISSPALTPAVRDGGFEDYTTSAWRFGGIGARRQFGEYSRCGAYHALFGSSGDVKQRITVPNDAGAKLRFYLNVTTADPSWVAHDFFYTSVVRADGTERWLAIPRTNLQAGEPGVYTLQEYSIGQFAGETLTLRFRSTNDGIYQTTFRVDDVAIAVPLVNHL